MQIEKSRVYIKYNYFILSCLCTMLDGFLLIFIGYNTSILSKENKWQNHPLRLVDIVYHLISASGGVLSIYTGAQSNMSGIFFGLFISLTAFFCSFNLLEIKNFQFYLAVLFIICLSNGHIQNICTTQVVKKFSSEYRGIVYVFAYFFTQFGKFLFALILILKKELISKGKLIPTVIPIIILILLKIISSLSILFLMRRRKNLKESYRRHQIRKETIFDTINRTVSINHIVTHESSSIKLKSQEQITGNITDLFQYKWRDHTFNLIFLNLSLGIQFFSMINVFPLINGNNTLVSVEEIFFSKTLHTVFLLFIPSIFLFKKNTRKFLLFMTFSMSLLMNILIFLNVSNSSLIIHLFRFIWNVCFVTTNLYCAEAAYKHLRTVNTGFMYLMFKLSCIVEIFLIDRLISISLYVPIVLNIMILMFDMYLVTRLSVESHMKTIEKIEEELKEFIESSISKNENSNNYSNAKYKDSMQNAN